MKTTELSAALARLLEIPGVTAFWSAPGTLHVEAEASETWPQLRCMVIELGPAGARRAGLPVH